MGMKPNKIETQAFLNRNDDDESPGREWIKGVCVCVCALTTPPHVHVYVLERSQHKVPEEALKVSTASTDYQ